MNTKDRLEEEMNAAKDRFKVLMTINHERDYQEELKSKSDSHVNSEFPLGSALSAIEYNLSMAREHWYFDIPNKDTAFVRQYQESMDYLRKIAAICVAMGEQYGMPERDVKRDFKGTIINMK